MLNHQRDLEFNNETCVGCGTCLLTCPMGESVIRWGTTPDEKVIVDVEKCVHCGVCAYFCPSGALRLFINAEERIELRESVDQIERHSLPDLKARILPHKRTGAPIKKYVVGSLKIPTDMGESAARNAIAACPTGALALTGSDLVMDEERCFYCDACSRSTGGRIIVRRKALLADLKDGVSPIVTRIIEHMMDEQAASRIIKGVAGLTAREKARSFLERS